MAYSTINKSSLYQNQVLYTGNATARSITGVGFQPDLLWIKDRTNANSHMLADAVRGATKYLVVDGTYAEATDSNRISAFDSDGFSIGTNNNVNQSSANDVAWNWKAGTTSGLSGGTITPSSYSINATSGIGIYKYTNNTVAGATIAHGLNSAPKMVMIKLTSHTGNWITGHAGMDSTFDYYLKLDENLAKANTDNMFNDTAPSSTLITLGNNSLVNYSISSGSYSYIMYAFSEVAGYSKFGTYTGNLNANGPFIYTGFRPAWFMTKRTDSTGNWRIRDVKRETFNPVDKPLSADNSSIENSNDNNWDILSNGLKLRDTGTGENASGGTYIYMAFGQPIISNGGVCATAR